MRFEHPLVAGLAHHSMDRIDLGSVEHPHADRRLDERIVVGCAVEGQASVGPSGRSPGTSAMMKIRPSRRYRAIEDIVDDVIVNAAILRMPLLC